MDVQLSLQKSRSVRRIFRSLLACCKIKFRRIRSSEQRVVLNQETGQDSSKAQEESTKSTSIMSSFRSASFKKGSRIELLDESWEDWLEKYQRGDRNLSELSRPTCFNGFGHMAPPLYRNEATRLKAVSRIRNSTVWESELEWLSQALQIVITRYRLKAASVSIIEQNVQQVVWQTGIGRQFQSISRDLSLDAHTLLSKDHFAVLDCSNDWRTRLNPLVHGPPFIKFYLGVNIFIGKVPVGCIAVCDPYLKTQLNLELVHQLEIISGDLSRALETQIFRRSENKNPRLQLSGETCLSLESASELNDSCESSSVLSLSSSSTTVHEYMSIQPVPGVPDYSATLQPITCKSVFQPFEVFESLMRCTSVQQVIKKACRIIQHNLGADATYLAECRTRSQASQITDVETKVRLVGHCKPNSDVIMKDLVNSQSFLIRSAINSDFGIQFTHGHRGEETMWSGMVMPLRRQDLRHGMQAIIGGFAVAVLYEDSQRKFSPGDQMFMKKVVRALENILTCFDQNVCADGCDCRSR